MNSWVARFVNFSRSWVARPAFDLAIMFLILVSLGLLIPEIALPRNDPREILITELQELITIIFAFELLMRYAAMKKRGRFLREYWIDILAVVPVLRAFRIARFFRLLRLLRLIRLASLLSNNSRVLESLLQQRTAEYLLTGFFVVFSVMAGTFAFASFESPNSGFAALEQSFWTVIFSIMSGQYEHDFPHTLGGRMAILGVEFCSLSLFAVLTGTVSAVMVEKLKEGTLVNQVFLEDLEGHVLVCGWNSGVEVTLQELQHHPDFSERDFVVITDREELPDLSSLPRRSKVRMMRDDFTRAEVLKKANVAHAAVALIVSDINHNRTRQDADARTVLAALTIEKLNPQVHTCAELSNGFNEPHLRMGNVNEVIITQEMAGHLMAQAALSADQLKVLQQMLRPSSKEGGLNPMAVVPEWEGKPFRAIVGEFAQRHGAIPVAVKKPNGEVFVNPTSPLEPGDILMCVGLPTS